MTAQNFLHDSLYFCIEVFFLKTLILIIDLQGESVLKMQVPTNGPGALQQLQHKHNPGPAPVLTSAMTSEISSRNYKR